MGLAHVAFACGMAVSHCGPAAAYAHEATLAPLQQVDHVAQAAPVQSADHRDIAAEHAAQPLRAVAECGVHELHGVAGRAGRAVARVGKHLLGAAGTAGKQGAATGALRCSAGQRTQKRVCCLGSAARCAALPRSGCGLRLRAYSTGWYAGGAVQTL